MFGGLIIILTIQISAGIIDYLCPIPYTKYPLSKGALWLNIIIALLLFVGNLTQ
jgi:hypothetical protein